MSAMSSGIARNIAAMLPKTMYTKKQSTGMTTTTAKAMPSPIQIPLVNTGRLYVLRCLPIASAQHAQEGRDQRRLAAMHPFSLPRAVDDSFGDANDVEVFRPGVLAAYRQGQRAPKLGLTRHKHAPWGVRVANCGK